MPTGYGSQQRVAPGFSHPGNPPKDQQKRKVDTDRKGLLLYTNDQAACSSRGKVCGHSAGYLPLRALEKGRGAELAGVDYPFLESWIVISARTVSYIRN